MFSPGNHDDRRALRRIVPDQPYAHPEFLYHRHDQGDLRVFALDSLSEGEIGGRLQDHQLDWLAKELAHPFDGKTFIAIHHPPCKPRLGRLDGTTLIEGAERLREVLDRQAQPATVLCGHMHRPFTGVLGQTLVCAATSTAFEFALRFDCKGEPLTQDAPYHYSIHAFDGGGGRSIHHRAPTL